MKINFINYKLIFFIIIVVFTAGCVEGSKSSNDPVVGIIDFSPGIAVRSVFDVKENDSGSQIATVVFTAETDGIVNYTTYDIDAVAKSDYLPQSGQYEMQAGQSYEIGIEILSDTRVEADEKVGILITDESGEELGRLFTTILNDDYPSYTLTASNITEGDLGTQLLRFTITLSESTVAPFPLSVATTDLVQVGSALAGTDYTAINSELVFVTGELSKTVEVEVFGDRDIELDETIALKVEHFAISAVVANGTIRSDDTPGNGAPTFRFNEGRSITTSENGSPEELVMKFKVDKSGGFTEDFIVNYRLASLASDVAISGDETDKAEEIKDFSTAVGQITILAAQESLDNEYTVSFELVDDEFLENNEVLEMVLFNDAGVEFGSGRIYIVDNESPEFKIYRKYTDLYGEEQTTSDLTYLEDSDYLGRREFYVELAGQVGYDYQFDLILRYLNDGEEGNAIDPDDVQGSGGANQKIIFKTIYIKKGNSFSLEEDEHIVSFSMEEDLLVEANERMMIEFRSSNGGTLGEAIPVNILNDDLPEIRWANTDLTTNVFESNEETPLNLILQLDNDELTADQQFGEAALENFDISIARSITPDSENDACLVQAQSDLSKEELTITTEGKQVYFLGSRSVPVTLAFVDDTDAECDEVVDLTVTLKSQSSGVNEYLAQLSGWEDRSDQVTVTSKNTDEATLTITGFNVTEDLDGGVVNFTAILNQDILLDAAFSVSSDGAEAGGADDNGDGVITYNANLITFDAANTFEFSGGVKERNISIAINDDSIVELDENYILNVVMDNNYPVKLKSISTVTTKTCNAIGLGCLKVGDEIQETSVVGKIVSEDRTSLEFNATKSEGLENDLAGNTIFTITTGLEIASDVPTIKYLLTDVCNDHCASMQGNVISSKVGANDFTTTTVVIHEKKVEGEPNTPEFSILTLPIVVNADDSVEPNEIVKVNSTLHKYGTMDDSNPNSISHYVNASEIQLFELMIINDDKLTPQFVNSSSSINEDAIGNGDASVGITWDKAIADNVPALSVVITAECGADGCSTDNSDFTLSNTNFEFFDGSGANLPVVGHSSNVGLKIVTDDLIEPNEDIILTMSLPGSHSDYFETVTNNVYTYQIKNDDFIRPYFVEANSNKVEGAKDVKSNGDVAIAWLGNIAKNVPSLNVSVSATCTNLDGYLCASADDYELETSYEIFGGTFQKNQPSDVSEIIDFKLVGDDIVEPFEEVTLTLGIPSGETSIYFNVVGANSSHLMTLNNDDRISPTFLTATSTVSEGITGGDTGTAQTATDIKIGWSHEIAANVPPLILEVVGRCDTTGKVCSTLAGTDYTLTSDFVVFDSDKAKAANTAGEAITLTITGDAVVEPTEQLTLSLRVDSGIATYFETNLTSVHDLSIVNDDKLTPSFVNSSSSIHEDATGNGDASVGITWDKAIADNVPALSVVITAECGADGCSTDNSDFTLSNTNFEFFDGSGANLPVVGHSSNVGLKIVTDDLIEPNEDIILTMSLPGSHSDYFETVTNNVYTYQIKNDDFIRPYFVEANSNKVEGAKDVKSNGDVAIAWLGNIAKNVPSLNVSVSATCTNLDGYLCASADDYELETSYEIFGGTFQKNQPSDVSEIIDFKLVGDDIVEPFEEVTLTLGVPSGETSIYFNVVGANSSHLMTLNNDDRISPTFLTATSTVSEGITGGDTGTAQTATDIKIGWSHEIAANVPPLILEVVGRCDTTGKVCSTLAGTDYTLTSDFVVFDSDKAKAANTAGEAITLTITGDAVVEPTEQLTLSLRVDSEIATYFETNLSSVHDLSIVNDDKLTPSFVLPESGVDEGAITAGSLVGMTWDKAIAENVPALSVELAISCAAGIGDESVDCAPGDGVDYLLSSFVVEFYDGAGANKPGTTDKLLVGLSIVGDSMVEPLETLSLTMTLPSSNSEFFIVPESGEFSETASFNINNDDELNFTYLNNGGSSSENLADQLNSGSLLTLAWTNKVSSNVPALVFSAATNCSGYLCATAEDRTVIESITVHNGNSLTQPSSRLIVTVADDAASPIVEPDEVVSVLLSLVGNESGDLNKYVIDGANWVNETLTFTLLDNEKITLGFDTFDPLMQEGTSDTNKATNIQFSQTDGSMEIASNVPDLFIGLNVACSSSSDFCSDADYNLASTGKTIHTQNLGESASNTDAISNVTFGLSIVSDVVIEPTTNILMTLTPTSSTYFNLPVTKNAFEEPLGITNDDEVTVSITATSKSESSATPGLVSVSWPEIKYQGISALGFSLGVSGTSNGTLTGNDFIDSQITQCPYAADSTDGDSLIGTYNCNIIQPGDSTDADGIKTVSVLSATLFTANADTMIEDNDEISFTLLEVVTAPAVTNDSVVVSVPDNVFIINDDHFNFELVNNAGTTVSGVQKFGESANAADTAHVLNINACAMGGGTEGNTTFHVQAKTLDNPSQYAALGWLDFSKDQIDTNVLTQGAEGSGIIANSQQTFSALTGSDCHLLKGFKRALEDNSIEPVEWLRLSVADHDRCLDDVCYNGSNTTGNEGVVAIDNGNNLLITDTGNMKCIESSASGDYKLVSYDSESTCKDTTHSIQDVEISKPALSFVNLNSAGEPVVDVTVADPYECVLDGSTGKTWSLFALGNDTGDDEKPDIANSYGNENGFPFNQTIDFAQSACALSGSWRLPTLNELMSVMNYSKIGITDAFQHRVGTYWALETCTTDGTDGRWAFNYQTGIAACTSSNNYYRLIHD